MPYAVRKVAGGFQVVNRDTGRVHAKHTTLRRARAQIRLLNGVEHGLAPTRR